jgi:putative endonuclease
MLPVLFTRTVIRSLDWIAQRVLPADPRPQRHQVGRRGEEDAYFHLRKLGYTMVARNFRSPRCKGEIDLIGWEDDVLCFIIVSVYYDRLAPRPQMEVFRNASLGG